ncbi:hypothetical protein M433DRAFT_149598 [Acidomyces richmondensis BFW]|nr:MAG: hypothetical protein FE78DRAFT_91215 [Acidomyces sp. 'richmondensis']KYG49845.1 hypothetical protein M433DRAFT_149598 [Acidomyces richmondensis BFW]
MLSQFQGRFQRLEQALVRLTDSIAAYNPSPLAATELEEVDEALSDDLEQLVRHQQNYRRIEELKRITSENDEKLKSHIRALAELRKEVAAIPSADGTSSNREVSVDDLLSYAKFISPTTLPPTSRKPGTRTPSTDAQMPNGTATPSGAALPEPDLPYLKPQNTSVKGMNEEEKAWIDPLANEPFCPWPSHELIHNGALADIQRMIEAGQDPGRVLSADEQAEVDRKKKEEEERERREEEERIRRRASMFDTSVRRRGTMQDDVFDPDA